jgi:hypothetical protein
MVRTLTGYGIPQDAICAILKVTRPTLEKRCRHELDIGAADANAKVAASMFRMATKGPYSVRFSSAKYWLACRAGWREPDRVLLTSVKSFMDMTAEEFDACLIVNGEQPVNLPPVPGYGHRNDGVVPFQRPRR